MNSVKKLKQLPFDTEHFLDIVGDASKRSRQVLLLLIFSSILILIAVVNSFVPEYNWYTSRILIQRNIQKYIVFNNDKDSTKVKNISQFIFENEKLNEIKIDSMYLKREANDFRLFEQKYPTRNIVFLRNPKFTPVISKNYDERRRKYNEIGNAINYVISHNIYSHEQVKEYASKLDESKIQHFDLVRVPILGISFDVNYLGFYSGMVISTLYFLLYFSLVREYISLKIAFKRGWTDIKHHHYYFYEYVSMLQVLSIPPKLFTTTKKANLFYSLFPVGAILFPLIVYLIVYLYDLKTFNIGYETNVIMTLSSVTITSISLILIASLCIYVIKIWIKLDRFWNNQTYEFNFEYILECIGEDEDIDLLDFSDSVLDRNNAYDVKALWYYTVINFLDNTKSSVRISKNKCMKMFGVFINRTLKGDFNTKSQPLDEVEINKYWKSLIEWFKNKGRKNIGSGFRESFTQMINELK